MIDFKEELQKISEEKMDSSFIHCSEEVSTTFQALNGMVTKLFKKQGAMSIQVEEMYSLIEENENTSIIKELEQENEKLINVLITAADLVEDCYLYYNDYYDEAMTPQSELMWNTLCKTMVNIGLIRISDENTPFDPQLNTIEGLVNDALFPDGFIVKVLKSGYQYKANVCRKSKVIVNKREDLGNE